MRKILAKNIRDLNHVNSMLDYLSDYVKSYESVFEELPEDECYDITMQLCEIEEFVIGKQLCTDKSFQDSTLRMMCYWEYIDGKCDFDTLIKNLGIYDGAE